MADLDPESGRPYRGVFIGRAVDMERRIIRYSSVSQIDAFEPVQGGGGCNRRWAFEKMGFGEERGVKVEKTDVQRGGNKFATSCEHYLATGVDVLEAELRAAKHLLPRYDPARPIDVEWPLTFDVPTGRAMEAKRAELGVGFVDVRKRAGDELFMQAVQLREILLGPTRPGGDSPEQLRAMIKRIAKLVAGDVPIMGAFDMRHTRGEYIDDDGSLKREAPGMLVVCTDDLKSTGNIFDRTTRPRPPNTVGTFWKGRVKTVAQILNFPQAIGYGVQSAEVYPEATHVRLGHVYIQTKGSPLGAKRSGLLTVEEVRERWRTRVVPVVMEMADVVRGADKPEDVPANLWACGAYHKPCDFAQACQRNPTMYHLLVQAGEIEQSQGESLMNNTTGSFGLFESLSQAPQANPIPQGPIASLGGFFSASDPAPVQPPPSAPAPITEEERQRRVAAAEAALRSGERAPCGAPGCGAGCAPGYVCTDKPNAFLLCNACKGEGALVVPGTAVVPALGVPNPGQVNPLDATPVTMANGAHVLPPEVVATITDPEILRRVNEAAERARVEAAAKAAAQPKKEGGRCKMGGQVIAIEAALHNAVKSKKSFPYTCTACGKETKAAPDPVALKATVQGHMMPKVDEKPGVVAEASADAPAIGSVGAIPEIPEIPAVAEAAGGFFSTPSAVGPASDARDFEMAQLRAEVELLRARLAEVARLAGLR